MKSPLKSLALILGVVLLSLPALRAEGPPPPAGGPGGGPPDGQREMRREKMGEAADELGLSADQKAQMKDLMQQEKAERDALRDNTSVAKEDKRAQMDAIRKSYMEKRQAIMTPEQREKAKAMREKHGKGMGGEGRPERHGPPPADAK